MLNTVFLKLINQPVRGLALLIAVSTAFPTVSVAQSPKQLQSPRSSFQLAQAQLSTDYTLGGGDRIRVNVFEVPDYTGEYQIPPGGAINLPLIGSVSLQGLTTEQAADTIAARYARYLKRPLISVNLLSPRPINVTVAGEVSRPGGYSLRLEGGAGDNPGVQYPTVLAALTTAQGVTFAADVSQVQLRRRVGRGGRQQTVTLDLREIIQSGNIPIDITLRDGDTIFVPKATSVNLADIRQLSYAGIAPDPTRPRTVAVVGEVTRPGTYVVTAEGGGGNQQQANTGLPNVTRAIQLAGGLTSLADIGSIQLRRRTRDGAEQTINVNLRDLLQRGDVNQDTLLQDGDTIVVPEGTAISLAEARLLSQVNLAADPTRPRAVAIIGEVNRPGTYLVTPGNAEGGSINAPVGAGGGQPSITRAIQLAGGITSLADIRNIKIRRPTRAGGEQVLDVNLWQLVQTGDTSQDTIVQEGDTVIIPTATELTPGESTVLATTTLSPGRIQLNVAGEVKRPGPVEVQPNSSLSQAILAAGGFNDARAKSAVVDLVRLNPDGSVTKRAVKVEFAAGINDQTNPIVRNNDIILVRRSRTAEVGDAGEGVIRALNPVLTILRLLIGI